MGEVKTPTGVERRGGSMRIIAVPLRGSCRAAASRRRGLRLDEIFDRGPEPPGHRGPVGFVSMGDYVSAGARTGAFAGGLAGVALGAALLLVPGIGPIVVAGPLAAAMLAGIEGAVAGVALGAAGGAHSCEMGVPREHAIKYETEVKGGKYLVIVRGYAGDITKAKNPARQKMGRRTSWSTIRAWFDFGGGLGFD